MKLQSLKSKVAQNFTMPESRTVMLRRSPEVDDFGSDQWERIFDTVTNGLRIVDLQYRTVRVNEAFCRMAGATEEETIDRYCYDYFPGQACNTDDCPLRQITGGKDSIEFEAEKERQDGSRLTCIVTVTAHRDDTGNLIGIIECFTDITERKLAERQLKKTHDALAIERGMLGSKNAALKEILGQFEEQKQQTEQHLQSNVNRIVRPILGIINEKLSHEDQHLMELLESTLSDLLDPVANRLEHAQASLSPREIEVSNMIRRGFSTKQIASILNVSVHTVNNQRRCIRRKLQINDNHTNLESYLKGL
ncbi:MAG: PAS domain S-box protein [candidate division Zixibacteria bacterium]|nr:PAS domain S-box protein [candidate division Zixibacteria bacterium]